MPSPEKSSPWRTKPRHNRPRKRPKTKKRRRTESSGLTVTGRKPRGHHLGQILTFTFSNMKMTQIPRRFIILFAFGVLSVANCSLFAGDDPYHLGKEIPIGGAGGFDYLSIDPAARRLYVSHASKVVVVDIDKDAIVGEIADTPGIHGVALAPDLGRGFSSNGRESKASIVDLKTLP